jgi:glutamate synthase (NADPH/NADH) small chain
MADPKGFLKYGRELPPRRSVEERKHDWIEVYLEFPDDKLKRQAARCMDCGIPFCHQGCPLGNIIPDWNDLTYRGRWREGLAQLHATNNFPEFTGKLCPAPCESACVLGINQDPVTIRRIEESLAMRGWAEQWITPEPPETRTGKTVAVVGSGPAGLAAAQQLNRAGHTVTVFERDDKIGGLLRYGIPDFKMEKWVLDRRLQQMEAEGVLFRPCVNVGVDVTAAELQAQFDAIVLAGGSTVPRDLPVPGRELDGIHFAMEFLPQQNRRVAGIWPEDRPQITAEGKRVVILGGGDTGADCLGTVHRQGAREVYQFEIMPMPPSERNETMPWPDYPMILRTSAAHEEGGKRDWSISTKAFSGENGRVQKLHGVRVAFSPPDATGRRKMEEAPGSEFEMEADLVLLALGFLHPQKEGLLADLGVEFDARGNVKTDRNYAGSVPGVFACGDMRRGQSLIVWAIAEGREAARGVDLYLMGDSKLPLTRAVL